MPLDLAAQMTALLKKPNGTQTLRPTQALALHDIGVVGGLFGPIGVGEGKTLITLLAPYVLDAKRPVLVLPATLIPKTESDRKRFAEHWEVPNNLYLISYEMLGRVQSAEFLETYRPDVLMFDESHKVKNLRAAVSRRVARFIHDHPEVKVIALSGTVMRRSIRDFAHILRWCLKDQAPVPVTNNEVEEWAYALDERVNDFARLEPGALLELAPGGKTIEDARRGFRARLVETPGVVATIGDGERIDASIYLRKVLYNVKPITNEHFDRLRRLWERPDGKPLEQGNEVWRHARELALGFHYEWNPPPPDEWMSARRAWSAFVRSVLSYSRTLDSPLAVIQALDLGNIKDKERLEEGRGLLEAWRFIKPSFKPKTVAIWHDDSALNVCADWGKKAGIIWVEHKLFGDRLSKMMGCPYFGESGFSETGEYIEHTASKTIIASVRANKEGKNLQAKWNRNLVVSPSEGADTWQQLIGRTHRPGQEEDEVEIDVLLGCAEHANAWRRAWASALAVRDTTGADSKLLLADVDWPTDFEIDMYAGARWRNNT